MLLATSAQSPIPVSLAWVLWHEDPENRYKVTVSNSGSVGKGFLLRRYFSINRQVTSSIAITLRSPGVRILLLLYLDFRSVLGDGPSSVRGSSVVSIYRGLGLRGL